MMAVENVPAYPAAKNVKKEDIDRMYRTFSPGIMSVYAFCSPVHALKYRFSQLSCFKNDLDVKGN